MADLSIAIVGAGIHAAVVAVRLLHEWPGVREGLRLFDPAGAGLADWRRRTWGQGMEVMRSPGAHHLDVPSRSLLDYADAHGRQRELMAPYHRPSLQLFGDHSRWVLDRYRLDPLIMPATIVRLERGEEGYRLHGADGTIVDARSVILAPGLRGHERMPAWARELARVHPACVRHVEWVDLRSEDVVGARVLVVGGGLSAATVAAAAAARGAHVTLVSRHRLEARLFDADPGWVGPKYLTFFQREPDPAARLRMIRGARGRASVTPELLAQLRRQAATGRLCLLEEDEVVEARWEAYRETVAVRFRDARGTTQRVHQVWCCTGFEPSIGRLDWLDALLPAAVCQGRPIVGPTLELSARCFVSGWLAELWVGPAARNISGARLAASQIAEALRPHLVSPAEPARAVA
jgi:cation diffusion facilitator CzcD-associated flavoprotein CzcO